MSTTQRNNLKAFTGLSENDLNQLYNLAEIKKLRPDEVLIKEGDTGQTVYIVMEGNICINKKF